MSFLSSFFGGQGNSSGRRRNIAESFSKTLCKILGKFCENFTKIATLTVIDHSSVFTQYIWMYLYIITYTSTTRTYLLIDVIVGSKADQ